MDKAAIRQKNTREALHLPKTMAKQPMGADIKVSKVPSLLSSAKDLMVRKGTNAGAPKVSPTTKDDKGGRIQSVVAKLSIKKRKPMPSSARK